MSAEMQRAQRRSRARRLVVTALVLDWVNDDHGIHELSQLRTSRRAQGSELLLRGAIQFPLVHASDAEPGADLLPAHALLRRRRPLAAVAVHPREELPLGIGVAPSVRLEPPAPHRLHQWREVTMLAGLLERRVQVIVVALQHCRISVGGQYGADGRWAAGGTRQNLGTVGM